MSNHNSRIITFNPEFIPAFVELNKEWIQTHFVLEATDLYQLNNPQGSILKLGGEIFFVLENGIAVGTCAMIPHGPKSFELAKMAVSPKVRGKGYGDLLMTTAIQWARDQGASEVNLLSNTILEPAITLYKKHGFITVHLGNHPDYERCNIEMKLPL